MQKEMMESELFKMVLLDRKIFGSEMNLFVTVPYIRFRKGLRTDILGSKIQIGHQQGLELQEINAEKERTVFVVNSESLLDFLKECNVTSNNYDMELPWKAVDQVYYNLSSN
jgi:hypothetical protein